MRIVKSARAMQKLAGTFRSTGTRIGFVPTMGCLHEGHLSLVRRAREVVGENGKVVVSIYVNPTQFGPREDFTKYPRTFERDAQLGRKAGVDVLFTPVNDEMYPPGETGFSTYVTEEALSKPMEGQARPTHLRGVTTIVTKLFHLVDPDVAVFGQKDFQQAAVIQRMVRDLAFRVRIDVAPTVREPDGLALSSRNQYLTPSERIQATVLWRAIRLARARVKSAKRPLPAAQLDRELTRLIGEQPAARLDYIAFFDSDTLREVKSVRPGTHLALAVFIGSTRLIDNAALE